MRATNERLLHEVPPRALLSAALEPLSFLHVWQIATSCADASPHHDLLTPHVSLQLFGTMFNAQVLTNAPVANIGQTFIYKVRPFHAPSLPTPLCPPPLVSKEDLTSHKSFDVTSISVPYLTALPPPPPPFLRPFTSTAASKRRKGGQSRTLPGSPAERPSRSLRRKMGSSSACGRPFCERQ
jgi:hypothetical protein